MSPSQTANFAAPIEPGAWAWWEKRRLGYNIALGLAGWAAYALDIGIFSVFKHPSWRDASGAISMTLFLGAAFLLLMGVANILFLLGAISESIIAPANRDSFRKQAFALGFFGSMSLPFVFPLANLALLIDAYGLPF